MESKLLPNFPNSAKKVSNINANAKVSTTRRWLSSRPAHSPVSSLASGNVSRCDRRCDQAVVMTIGARSLQASLPRPGRRRRQPTSTQDHAPYIETAARQSARLGEDQKK